MTLYVKACIVNFREFWTRYNRISSELQEYSNDNRDTCFLGVASVEAIEEDNTMGRVVAYSNIEYFIEEVFKHEHCYPVKETDEDIDEAKKMLAVALVSRCVTDNNILEFGDMLLSKWPEARKQPTEIDAVIEAAEKELRRIVGRRPED